ncbi:hypothetical protein CLAFUW4_08993 [Fulvia fulva]|nr:hypothetical protein CLAFUR4_08999 [Fulvia fulva]KAK4614517.1 hypothetical protein CLAFUR0_08991 [Fulvia fulva]WPV20140.1 hypothetical protein CLAFUW4_08993 [Fulvia fulva]WPV35254.1 hypothetical protein CLAFUW7_08994 [Fulvia fulva]
MGLHKRHNAGRVLRDADARNHLAMHKRDSHGDQPRMHVPDGFEQTTQDDSRDSGGVSVVYVTLPQTFSGAAVYSTIGVTPTADSAAQSTDDASYASAMASYSSAMSEYNAGNGVGASATPVAVVTPKSSAQSTLATSLQGAALASSSVAATRLGGTPVQATRAATASTSSNAQIEQSGSEMSGGAKAGLAFGIILAIAAACGLIFFCWRRKRNTKQQEDMLNEKHGSFADAGARRVEAGGPRDPAMDAMGSGRRDSSMTEKVPASVRSSRTTSTAPRLSLRPVTQFLPNIGDNNAQNRNTGNNLEVAGAQKRTSGWERTPAGAQQNPFDDATAEKQARSNTPPQNPFDEPEGKRSNDSQDAARAAGVAAGAAVMANKKHSPKSSWEGSDPATPKSTRFGTAAAVPVAGSPRGPPPPRGPNNVHRVQLDFKPSMEDELELISGQLVRMLHEYDDGWALCIRMDRSQQGVAPRTCLSKLPVKPRPQGPPPQGSRPGTSQGPSSPSNPPGPNGPMHQGPIVPRPLTPSQGTRSPSPTSSNGEASTSTGGAPAKIERKPVPGQAM